jgi:predicted DNA-binding WGR domain protein
MKIVSIFEGRLFAFHYENEAKNEYDRLMDLWTNVSYLKSFAENNNVADLPKFIRLILQAAEEIQDFLESLNQENEPFGQYFEPLEISEYAKQLAFQKGKIKKNQLRYYALKLDDNCFVITGGAIKMSQTMQEHPDTQKELTKLEQARKFLRSNGVFDDDSFFELLSEQP